MSVENCAPAVPKATASGNGHSVKGKARAAGEAGTPDASGFSALLMQLGANDADGAAGELTLAADDAAPALVVGEEAKLPVADGTQVDPGLLLAQSMQFQQSAQPVNQSILKSLRSANQPAGKGPEAGLPAVAGPVQTDAVVQPPLSPIAEPVPVQAPTVASAPAPASAVKGMDVARPELGEAIKEVAAKAQAPQRSAQRAGVTEAAAAQSGGVANASAQVAAEAEARLHKLAQIEPRGETSPGVTPALVTAAVGESGVRHAERAGEKMESGQGGKGDGAWGHQALLATGSAEPSFTMAEPSAVLSPEVMVAEQVNYWIGHDVQNAELKLDGMGGSPVEVSISLQGNEARVEFRTDQLEARQVLEGAVSHLKDLLGNEGLVLSGVSVGSSGADSSASQEGKPRQNGRQAAVAVPELKSMDLNVRPARVSDRSVDLFV